MFIRVFKTDAEIAECAADYFEKLLTDKPNAVLGLATGASPVPTYQELIRRCDAGRISFSQASAFNLDEYCDLPKNDPNSYYTFMQEQLFKHVDIDRQRVHIENGNVDDYEAEARNYDEMIKAAGGIDLQLLGIGTNGHIGFNEPAEAFTEGTFRIKLTQSTIDANSRYFKDGNMPRYALTMGVATIMNARQILLIATGSAKAKAIYDTVKGPITPRCPASVLRLHQNAVLLLDEKAAALL